MRARATGTGGAGRHAVHHSHHRNTPLSPKTKAMVAAAIKISVILYNFSLKNDKVVHVITAVKFGFHVVRDLGDRRLDKKVAGFAIIAITHTYLGLHNLLLDPDVKHISNLQNIIG